MGVRPEPLGLSEHEGVELLEEDPLVVKEVLHPVRVAEGEMALEEQAIEARQGAGRQRRVLGDELPHEHLRPVASDRTGGGSCGVPRGDANRFAQPRPHGGGGADLVAAVRPRCAT